MVTGPEPSTDSLPVWPAPDSGAFLDRPADTGTDELAGAIRSLRRSVAPGSAYDAWIFDFDGTLADSGDLVLRTTQAVLRACGVTVDDAWLMSQRLSTPAGLRARLRDRGIDVPGTDEQLMRAGVGFWLAHSDQLRPVGPVVALAKGASRSGLPLGVASANHSRLVRRGLTTLGLADVFTAVVGRDHVPEPKPAPDVFLRATELLRVAPSRCLAFENTDSGVAAATAAGLDVVDVRTWF